MEDIILHYRSCISDITQVYTCTRGKEYTHMVVSTISDKFDVQVSQNEFHIADIVIGVKSRG